MQMFDDRRNLDGVYFRVKRFGEWKNICFSDLEPEEMDIILDEKAKHPDGIVFLKNLCKILGTTLRSIGDQFDIFIE